jgi:hypothetical protein
MDSNCSAVKTDGSSGGRAPAMIRRATPTSAAWRTARSVTRLRPRSFSRAMRYIPASMIPHARLQPSAPIRRVRILALSAATLSDAV